MRAALVPTPHRLQLWVSYQLLLGLQQSHAVGVVHGDIKCENCLLTSWGWAYIADFAPFKPARLPADNPVRGSMRCLLGEGGAWSFSLQALAACAPNLPKKPQLCLIAWRAGIFLFLFRHGQPAALLRRPRALLLAGRRRRRGRNAGRHWRA